MIMGDVCGKGEHLWQRGAYVAKGGIMEKGIVAGDVHDKGGGACMAGEMATAVDGMHPTGMHSC